MKTVIQAIAPDQISIVAQILKQNDLPIDDIHNPSIQLFVAIYNKEIIGVVGVEKYDNISLLRSLAVLDSYKGEGVGKQLIHYFEDWCESKSVEQIYLLTTTADQYFLKYGFQNVKRDLVPEDIKSTAQFKDICPDSAVVMKKILH